MVIQFVAYVGATTLNLCEELGFFVIFFLRAVRTLISYRLKIHKTLEHMLHIGVESFNIAVLTGTFTGMAFALQSYIGFQRVGGEQFIGTIVALGMIRELGPVLTGLMVTGRSCSAIAAEIGTMSITEQIDALRTLGINTFQYLVVPRMVAGTIIMPFLTLFSMIFGIAGGYIICVYVLQLSGDVYMTNIRTSVEMSDIRGGLIKAAIFGLILTWVGSFKGFYTRGGARGVGIATTQAVVISSIMILVSNYFLTKFLERL